MRKQLLMGLLFSILLLGCTSSPQATKQIAFYLNSKSDNQNNLSHAIYTYDDDNELVSAKIKVTYSGLKTTLSNNTLFDQYRTLVNLYDGLEGVKVTLKPKTDGYEYQEKWDFQKVNVTKMVNLDERQQVFVKDNQYNLNKIKTYYQKQGYSVDEKELKD